MSAIITDIAQGIKIKRQTLGLSQKDFAELIGLNDSGDRTVRGWELGEHKPTPSKLAIIRNLPESAPLKNSRKKNDFSFIDLFAGIGGIRYAFQNKGGNCVLGSEWDKFAKKTYAANYGDVPKGDITKIHVNEIPDHDILVGGFPCQTFSQAGLKSGFEDTRGTMFFEIQRILAAKQPKAFMLENVKQLVGHRRGETLKTILGILRGQHKDSIPKDIPMSADARIALATKLNYWVDYRVLRAGDFGVPQNRERVFLIGFKLPDNKAQKAQFIKQLEKTYKWPTPPKSSTCVGDILESSSSLPDKYTISDKLYQGHIRRKEEHKAKGNGFGFSVFNKDSKYTNTLSARYYKDGSEILIDQSHLNKNPRKLTPRECARLQGFPEEFIVDAVSGCQAYKQFGNSVAVPVISAIAEEMTKAMKALDII